MITTIFGRSKTVLFTIVFLSLYKLFVQTRLRRVMAWYDDNVEPTREIRFHIDGVGFLRRGFSRWLLEFLSRFHTV